MAPSLGAGGTAIERIYLGALLGLAGALPGTAAAFSLLNAAFCHPLRSPFRQALAGAVWGSLAYVACILIGSVTLGPFLEPDHPWREPLARMLAPAAGLVAQEFIVVVLFAPLLPMALASVLHARSAPKARTR